MSVGFFEAFFKKKISSFFQTWIVELRLCASPQRREELPRLLLHLRRPGRQEETRPLQALRQQDAKVGLTSLRPSSSNTVISFSLTSDSLPRDPPPTPTVFASSFSTCRYLNEQIKLGPDIVSNTFYKEQFDAVEQCFKVIGFTLEVK